MFSDTMASNGAVCSTPHAFAHTSISSGGSTLLSPANLIQLAVLVRASESGSLGHQVRLGIAPAKCTACSPVPQPISSTAECAGRTRLRISRIGATFRPAEGEYMRWSALTPRCSSATGRRLLSSVMGIKSFRHGSGLSRQERDADIKIRRTYFREYGSTEPCLIRRTIVTFATGAGNDRRRPRLLLLIPM